MSKHVHYDVERLIADMKADDESVVLPSDAHEVFRVVQRMRPAWREMMRAMFEEENRETPTDDVVTAFAWLQAEYISNLSASFSHDPVKEILTRYVTILARSVAEQRRQDEGEITTCVKVHETQGGRA